MTPYPRNTLYDFCIDKKYTPVRSKKDISEIKACIRNIPPEDIRNTHRNSDDNTTNCDHHKHKHDIKSDIVGKQTHFV